MVRQHRARTHVTVQDSEQSEDVTVIVDDDAVDERPGLQDDVQDAPHPR